MDKKINILILSVGTRNKIIQYFKENLIINNKKIGNIIATDSSPLAPAIYVADKYYIVPRVDEEGYIERIIEICKKEKISGILSLIDPELSVITEKKEYFEKIGVKIIGSNLEQNEISLDKIKMYNWLISNGYDTARSYDNFLEFEKDYKRGIVSLPIFVKPVKGSASLNINKVTDIEYVRFLTGENDNLMFQEYLNGQEIGADVYIDLISGEVVSIFLKKKLKMRAGETDKAVSFKDKKLYELIINFVHDFGYQGQIDIDIFEMEGRFYISEVNPRFGGGYPHAYEAGANHMKLIINNLLGIENRPIIGKNYKEGVYMMKYNEIMIRNEI